MPTFLELRHFRLIQQIAATQNITRAAAQLHVSQPALSRQLRDIETKLGIPLFDRHGKTIHPTAAGRYLLSVAAPLLEQAQRAEQAVLQMAKGQAGSLRLATECFTCYRWLPRIIQQFQAQHPQVEVDINMQATRDPVAALQAGALDLALAYSPLRDPKLATAPLFDDALVVVLPARHPLAAKPFWEAADFADEHLLLYDAETADVLREVLQPAGIQPRRVSSLHITDGLLNLVKAGLGITVVAGWVVTANPSDQIVTRPITATGMPRRWQAVWSATTAPPAYLTDFVALLCAEAEAGCMFNM